jgi:hypothetical protein
LGVFYRYVRTAAEGVTERALLSVFNPTNEIKTVNVTLPMYYAGFAPGARVNITMLPISTDMSSRLWAAVEERTRAAGSDGGRGGVGATTVHTVGADGAGGLYDVVVPCVLPATSYAIFTVTEANDERAHSS